jgi:hypothetical protein
MAEPVTLQTLLTYLTLISVPVGVFYHIMTLRNTKKNQEQQLETRQAQLFMNLYETWRSPEFRKNSRWINKFVEYKDSADFHRQYGSEENLDEFAIWTSISAFYEGIGVLVRRGLINLDLVDDLLRASIKVAWEKMGPEFVESRVIRGNSDLFNDFEYLYNEIKKREEVTESQ